MCNSLQGKELRNCLKIRNSDRVASCVYFLGSMPEGDAMPRPQRPFTVKRRNDSKTFQFTINPASGLPRKICQDWRRRSFQDLPDTLALYRAPKNKTAAETGRNLRPNGPGNRECLNFPLPMRESFPVPIISGP
jgi:hypothetical protein